MKPLLAVLIVTSSLFTSRQAATDLEVGVTPGATKFISYQDLLTLPQVDFTSTGDSNFAVPARLGGVPLEQLKRSLASDADMVVAIGSDGYRSNYPASYLAAHHPVLVLTVDGKPSADWPKTHDGNPLGPYVIANPSFVPAFKVLSHEDEAQIPFEVVRIDFRSESQVFAPIAPKGDFAPASPVMNGYTIARQNCYRCHNMGAEGGTLAGLPWRVLAAIAKASPTLFANYVRDPKALNPKTRMAASPGYDDETIAALRAYFSTFVAGEQK